MILCPVPRQLLPRPFALIFNHDFRSHQTLFSRFQMHPPMCIISSLSCPNISRTFRALEFQRCPWYSTATFNANKSRFPTHRELCSKNPPSNELIRCMGRWEVDLGSSATLVATTTRRYDGNMHRVSNSVQSRQVVVQERVGASSDSLEERPASRFAESPASVGRGP